MTKQSEMPLDAIERAKSTSKQPRFSTDANTVFGSVLRWIKMAEIDEPDYSESSSTRDTWLQSFWHREPHLAGVMNAVTLIDSNRGWTLTGGRNQVIRYTNALHNAEDGGGWRQYFKKSSLSYWSTDLGSITEAGRDGRSGPLRAIFHVDPGCCQLTGKTKTPLQYKPASGKPQLWRLEDFFRVCSMPNDSEKFRGLGYCAVSRALELAKLMLAIYQHDQEKLGARMPRGLLILQNVTEDQWNQSLEARDLKLDSLERKHYAGVQVLASGGMEQVDAKLVALSNLPDGFDRKTFADQLMYGYALCFGYDPSEFWPVQFGALGRGTETAMQAQKSTAKGVMDFTLSYQERLQQELPDTILFEFEQRDEEGERVAAEVAAAQVSVVTQAYESGLMAGQPLLDREEARSLLAEYGVIPHDWTEMEEDVESTDTEGAGQERALDDIRIQRAIE